MRVDSKQPATPLVHSAALIVTLWLSGMYLRVTMLAVPPVVPLLHASLDLDETWIGLLSLLPVMLFAAAALPGSYLIARSGAKRTLLMGLLLAATGGALRGAVADRWMVLAMTLVMGAGIAIMQPALASLVRQWYPQRVGFATAVYTNGLLVGEVLSAGISRPVLLPLLHDSWRLSFVFWSLPAIVPIALLPLLHPAQEQPQSDGQPLAWWPDWHDPRIWIIGFILGGVSTLYFGTNTFLPDFLDTSGRTEWISASLAALNGAQLLASVLLIVASGWLVGRRAPFFFGGVGGVLAVCGLLLAPQGWVVVFAAAIGFCSSLMLILTLALPPLLTPPNQTHRLSAPLFTVGYLTSFVGAIVGGSLWDGLGIAWVAFLPALITCTAIVGLSLALRLPPHDQH